MNNGIIVQSKKSGDPKEEGYLVQKLGLSRPLVSGGANYLAMDPFKADQQPLRTLLTTRSRKKPANSLTNPKRQSSSAVVNPEDLLIR